MDQRAIDAYIITNSDPHISEYIPGHWKIISWFSGFTGSSATIIITHTFVGLWTDSRYTLQAEKQLSGSGIELIKFSSAEQGGYQSWLSQNLSQHARIGLDGRLVSIASFRKIRKAVEEKNITLDIECDLISEIWSDRPPLPANTAFEHMVNFSGKDRSQKLKEVREEMAKDNIDYHLLASPDDIMWLLNIRGRDVEYSPLLLSFAIIDSVQVLLFTDEEKIPYRLAMEFDKEGIILLPYEEISGMLSTIKPGSSILISPATTSAALYSSISGRLKIREDISIPSRMKAIKNSVEISGLGRAMIRDGVALTRFFYRIESDNELIPMSELSLSKRLDQERAALESFIGTSFPTIVAYNEHAALPHYTATAETDLVIGSNGILLVDSGGQYLDGTTDITRTISLGNSTAKQKKDFTLVLKGMINLATASFPSGTFGNQLDILARKYLWENGLNYGHGTGHGVGFCLNVHEGPQRISMSAENDKGAYLTPGMVVSDEPAVYREGEYGIRTENLLLCYEDEETEFGKFNRFNTLSLCYIDTSLIEFSMLDKKEVEWLNEYHREVYAKISPHLREDEEKWLKMKTTIVAPASSYPA
jgi:Xaa-Pro aminopeptidase